MAEPITYGALPEDLGLVDISPVEMMAWLYLPIMTPSSLLTVPPNLRHFDPIVQAALLHDGDDLLEDKYVYLTAKTLWVTPANPGNRPGWHSDGFGTDDVNFIWYDRAPTEFLSDSFTLTDDCADAMAEMARRASWPGDGGIVTYPDKHLLRLTPAVVHRSPVDFEPGMRTFVKVSISPDRYDLEGNSINHGIAERWPLVPRKDVRNHPSTLANADTSARSVLAREEH